MHSMERIQQRTGGRLSTFPYVSSKFPFLRRGCKISSCVELECGTTPASRRRSSSSRREVFDCPLSGQSVCEQTSGVLRHTESVRDDKVQEQDWRQALEQKSRAPPARPRITSRSHAKRPKCQDDQVQTLRTVADTRSNDPVRSQASSENESV